MRKEQRGIMQEIVLKENEWAEAAIKSKQLGKKKFDTLRRVARYYLDCGYSQSDVKDELEHFLTACDPQIIVFKWSNLIDAAVRSAERRPALDIDGVNVSAAEMGTIDNVSSRMGRRIAFTLLCLSKYYNAAYSRDDYWVALAQKYVMELANVNTSLRRQGLLYNSLSGNGLIQFPYRVDGEGVKVLFADEGEPILIVSDFRNIGWQYQMFHGEPYFKCERCGLVIKYADPNNKRRQKYCSNCASLVIAEQKTDYVMRKHLRSREN